MLSGSLTSGQLHSQVLVQALPNHLQFLNLAIQCILSAQDIVLGLMSSSRISRPCFDLTLHMPSPCDFFEAVLGLAGEYLNRLQELSLDLNPKPCPWAVPNKLSLD